LILAKRIFGEDYEVRGVTATSEYDVPVRTAEIANRTAREMEMEVKVTPEEVINYDEYVGEGYGIPSPAGNEAVELFARTEGIILDPIYTGKCAAGLIDHIRSGHFDRTDSVLFIHTGGHPAIFTHSRLWH
jgi:D-cysteine desulfhydrase/L-cysteate sulfo-lyase